MSPLWALRQVKSPPGKHSPQREGRYRENERASPRPAPHIPDPHLRGRLSQQGAALPLSTGLPPAGLNKSLFCTPPSPTTSDGASALSPAGHGRRPYRAGMERREGDDRRLGENAPFTPCLLFCTLPDVAAREENTFGQDGSRETKSPAQSAPRPLPSFETGTSVAKTPWAASPTRELPSSRRVAEPETHRAVDRAARVSGTPVPTRTARHTPRARATAPLPSWAATGRPSPAPGRKRSASAPRSRRGCGGRGQPPGTPRPASVRAQRPSSGAEFPRPAGQGPQRRPGTGRARRPRSEESRACTRRGASPGSWRAVWAAPPSTAAGG